MIVLPAIDILDGKPVRLYKGDYNQVEEVKGSILELALMFQKEGAQYLHLVDLDGAKKGFLVNQEAIIEVAKTLSIPIEVGGGIRTLESISYYLDNGVSRIILGTSALEDETLLMRAIAKYPRQIAVGVDCKVGFVYGRGWLEASSIQYIDFAKKLEAMGVETIIVTDIAKDGTLEGVNIEMLKLLQKEVSMNIIASGGIRDMNDIVKLKDISIYGAITGKAMYHKTLNLNEALAYVKE